MPDEISPELFDQLAEFAALELAPEEREYLRGQLNSQLKAIGELERIPVPDDVPPAAHGVPYPLATHPPARADVIDCDAELAARIGQQAPEADEGYFVVPDIPHTELA